MTNKIKMLAYAAVDFPDSNWSLSLQPQGNEMVISLHWNGKAVPTHQARTSLEDFKIMLKKLDVLKEEE